MADGFAVDAHFIRVDNFHCGGNYRGMCSGAARSMIRCLAEVSCPCAATREFKPGLFFFGGRASCRTRIGVGDDSVPRCMAVARSAV